MKSCTRRFRGNASEQRLAPAYVVCHPGLARQVPTDLRGFDRTGLVYDPGPDGNGATARQIWFWPT